MTLPPIHSHSQTHTLQTSYIIKYHFWLNMKRHVLSHPPFEHLTSNRQIWKGQDTTTINITLLTNWNLNKNLKNKKFLKLWNNQKFKYAIKPLY